jgi:multidrug resistance efflux pump
MNISKQAVHQYFERQALEQARLNLQRTQITAPFDAAIISRNVNEGSQVNAGDLLARLVGTDEY